MLGTRWVNDGCGATVAQLVASHPRAQTWVTWAVADYNERTALELTGAPVGGYDLERIQEAVRPILKRH